MCFSLFIVVSRSLNTVTESIRANRRDAAGDRHRGQAAAAIESWRANRRDAAADRQGGQFFSPLEWRKGREIADVTTQIQLLNGTTGKRSEEVDRCAERQGLCTVLYRHRGQAAAARESINANRHDAAADCQGGQAAAATESIKANRRDAAADRQGGQFFFPLEWRIGRVIADVTTQVQLLNGTTGKRSAAGRCDERQGHPTVLNGHRGQAAAAIVFATYCVPICFD